MSGKIYEGPEWPEHFYGPRFFRGHCADVLAGCYDIPLEIKSPVILDIGANVGAFARWALKKWPDATVHCYEPEPSNFVKLSEILNGDKRTVQYHCAIGPSNRTARMSFEGKLNCGEYFCQEGNDVMMFDAASLPYADIIKIDTEGMENDILERMSDRNLLTKTKAIVLEYHDGGDAAYIMGLLRGNGFGIHQFENHSPHRGILKFLRK